MSQSVVGYTCRGTLEDDLNPNLSMVIWKHIGVHKDFNLVEYSVIYTVALVPNLRTNILPPSS
jgi:hypothetical protein